jgi:4-amino-4-deoxy-L-arabinose transferase-like glycosyltransferase
LHLAATLVAFYLAFLPFNFPAICRYALASHRMQPTGHSQRCINAACRPQYDAKDMTGRQLKTGLHAALALAAGLALRLWFVAHVARVTGDTLLYGNIARNWMQHGIYSFTQPPAVPVPTLIRLPGYPLFLMICFRTFGVDHYTAVMYVQCMIDLLTCLLISGLAGRLFGRRAAMAALWLSALCPFTAIYTAAPLTEVLTLFCIALTFYSLKRWIDSLEPWRDAGLGFTESGTSSSFEGARLQEAAGKDGFEGARLQLRRKLNLWNVALATEGISPSHNRPFNTLYNRWLWITAIAMAYSILLRPEQGLLAATVIPAMLWTVWQQAKPLRLPAVLPIVLAALCVVLPLAPWTVRNWRTFHVIQPLAPRYATDPGEFISTGFQRWYRTWAIDFASTEEVYWNYDSAPVEIGDLPPRAFDSDGEYARTEAILNQYNHDSNATPALDARFEALAEERIHNDPIRYYVALPIARLLNMLFRPRAEMLEVPLEWWRWREHPQMTLLAAGLAALNLGYVVLGALGLWRWRIKRIRRRNGWGPHHALVGAMLAFVVLRCALLLTLDNSEPRYTLEFFPLLIVWASYLFRSAPLERIQRENPG